MTNEEEMEKDRIEETFRGKVLFISGGSGFLGKVLLEKLLRCCSSLDTIYLLLRDKKGKTAQERLEEIFENSLFEQLRKSKADAIAKCKMIAGDVTEVDLGISEADRKLLTDRVDFIYHSAATTRFDNSIKVAVEINTRGTKYMLDLASQCRHLACFVHVSTAYVHPEIELLEEKTYPPPANPHDVIDSIQWLDDDKNGQVTKAILGKCPNTYTYSKALAEELVAEQMDKIPIIITRPSVVIPIWKEPLPGWCNNLQGPMGLVAGAGKGIIRSMHGDPDAHADFISVDLVINMMLLATALFVSGSRSSRVYNLTTTSELKIKWGQILEEGRVVCQELVPFNGIVWYPGGGFNKSKIAHKFAYFFYQLIPAILIDMLLFVLGYKPVLYQIQRRIENGGVMFEYYTMRLWNFDSAESTAAMRAWRNDLEQKKYHIPQVEELDLKSYFVDCVMCIRRYLKETDDMLPRAKFMIKVMYIVDKIFKTVMVSLLFYYSFKWIVQPIFHLYD